MRSVQPTVDELGAHAHRQQSERTLAPRHLHEVESDAVIGAMHDPLIPILRVGALPHDADGRRLGVLVHVLQRLLHDPVDRDLLRRIEAGVARVEVAFDAETVAGLVLGRVVPDRAREAELGEDRRAKVVDHSADRVERAAELALQIRELRLQRRARFTSGAIGDALDVLDLEHRVREHLRRSVVDVAVQPLALRLEALEHPLRDGRDRILLLPAPRLPPAAAEVRGARFDVTDRELKLLEPAKCALARLLLRAARARLALGAPLVGLLELVDLLAQATHIAPQPFDDEVEVTVKVVIPRKLGGRALVDTADYGTSISTKGSDATRIDRPRSRARPRVGAVGRTRIWRIFMRSMTSRHPGCTPTTVA